MSEVIDKMIQMALMHPSIQPQTLQAEPHMGLALLDYLVNNITNSAGRNSGGLSPNEGYYRAINPSLMYDPPPVTYGEIPDLMKGGPQSVLQKITSAETSINKTKVPSIFKEIKNWEPGGINLDIGGGKYDTATNYLKEQGVTNLIYDPFNRLPSHNEKVMSEVGKMGGADTVTVSNVLNVIKEKPAREEVIRNAYDNLKKNGEAYFKVYVDPKKTAGETPKGWQNHKNAEFYKDEVESVFGEGSVTKITKDKIYATKFNDQVADARKIVESQNPNFMQEGNAIKDLSEMKRYEALGLESPVTARDSMTATEELATLKQTSKTKFGVNYTTGDLDPSTEIFPIALMAKNEKANWFKSILKEPESKEYMRGLEMNRNKSAIHPNSKTGVSMDFSTDCPERLSPCPYCYVEHGRVSEKLFNMKGNNKVIVETPYKREILAMPREMVVTLNSQGGMRAHSFCDYRPTQDYNQWKLALQDAEAKGLYIKAITKQPEFVEAFGDHPNLRINISVDWLPREMSNSPTLKEALALKAGRDNIKIRTVALNEEQAWKMAADPNVDVVTMYHGLTGDKLKQILMVQNKGLIDKVGKERLWKEIDSWQNMPGNSKAFKRLAEKYPNKICCQSGKCGGDPTKCGFGISAAGGLIAGVVLPEFLNDEGGSDLISTLAGRGL